MSWIEETDIQVGNIIKVMSIRPEAMEAVLLMNQKVTFGGSVLTRVEEEAIATTVSVANHCKY
jgi:alkylhydroperoxidase family enzyme